MKFFLIFILSQIGIANAQVTTDSLYVLPNPICNQLTIHYSIINNDTVSLYVFDLTGRQVHTFFTDWKQGAAFYTIQYDADSLQEGLYMLRLEYGFDQNKNSKFVKTCESNLLDNISVIDSINIYPNPVSDIIIIESSGMKTEQIEIFDLSGRVMKNIYSETQNEKMNMDVSSLSPGIYFIRIYLSNGKVVLKKFFKG